MIHSKLKYMLLMVCSSAMMMAQGPDPDAMPNDPNPLDAPIESNIFLLLVFGLLFAYKIFQKSKQVPQS